MNNEQIEKIKKELKELEFHILHSREEVKRFYIRQFQKLRKQLIKLEKEGKNEK